MLNLRHLTWAAAIAALLLVVGPAEAGGAGIGCPPTDPGCLPAPPGSVEVNPHPATSLGDLTTVDSGGVLMPVEAVISLPLARVDVAPLAGASAPSFPRLEVPARYQDPADVSCGVQALGMALSALPGAPPTSPALLGFLQGNGMMYDFGTGVEELAYAAQSFGYRGASSFYGGDLSLLASELEAGRPVVVSLGANGEGQPGHFVTVTGVSPDAQSHGDAWRWVSYNDPTLGEVTAPASEFMWLWGLQGYSGVTVAAEPPPSAPDPMPWVAFSAAIMALISISPLGRLRKGIGGKLEAGTSIGGSSKVTYSVPKPAPKPVANPKPAAPVGVEKAEALFEANPPPPPTPPIPPGVTKAEEEFEAHAPPEAPPPLDLAKLLQQDYAAGEAWESEMAYEAFRLAETSDSSSDTGLPATGDLALAARLGRLGYSGYRAYQASAVSFSALGSGYYGVAVDPTRIPVGERIPFRTDLGYAGTRYSASGLANATADHILEAANGKVAVGLAVGVPVAINLYDYGVGGHSDVGIQSPEFAASTLVDVGKSAAVGLAAAGIVAGVVLGVAALGVTAPAWGAIVAVAGVGLLLSAAIEAVKTADGKDADDALKQQVTEGIEAWGDIAEVVGDLVD